MEHHSIEHALTRLGKGRLLRIDSGRGKGLAVFRGAVWITQDNDPIDHFVEEGASFTFDHDGVAIVQALDPSKVLVFDAEAGAAR